MYFKRHVYYGKPTAHITQPRSYETNQINKNGKYIYTLNKLGPKLSKIFSLDICLQERATPWWPGTWRNRIANFPRYKKIAIFRCDMIVISKSSSSKNWRQRNETILAWILSGFKQNGAQVGLCLWRTLRFNSSSN